MGLGTPAESRQGRRGFGFIKRDKSLDRSAATLRLLRRVSLGEVHSESIAYEELKLNERLKCNGLLPKSVKGEN